MPVVPKANSGPQANRPRGQPQVAGLNTRRYFWLVVGYYLVTVYIRSTNGRAEGLSSAEFSSDIYRPHRGIKPLEDIPPDLRSEGGHGETKADSEHEAVHGIQIAKVDFEEVETPFIIALWIFCASLAKIGKFLQNLFQLHMQNSSVSSIIFAILALP